MAVRSNKVNLLNKIYFLTFTIFDWNNIFVNDKYCNLVYKWFDYIKENYNNIIYGYVIMPNHIHVITKLSNKSVLPPVLIQNAKRFMAYNIVDFLKEDNKIDLLNLFASNAKKNTKAKHKIFKDKYDSLVIQTPKFFLEKLNYIHNNPCQPKWDLADVPENYKYSSAANYILGKGNYEIEIMQF